MPLRRRRITTSRLSPDRSSVLSASQRIVPLTTESGVRLTRQLVDLRDPRDRAWGPTLGLSIARQTIESGAVIRAPRDGATQSLSHELDASTDAHRLGEFITNHRTGLIRHGSSISAADLLAQITLALPHRQIAVLGSRQTDLDRLGAQIKQRAPGLRIRRGLPLDQEGGWLAVSTFTGSADGDVHHCDVVILADATEVVHQRACGPLCAVDQRYHLVGLLRGDRRLSPFEQDKIFAAFGPAVLDIPAPGCTRRRVCVAWGDMYGPAIAVDDRLSLLRSGYWRHHARNRCIARWARVAVATPRRPLLASSSATDAGDDGNETCRVALLAASIEQALALAERLPDWPVVAGDADTSRMGRHRRDLLAERRRILPDGRRMIITPAAAKHVELAATDVLIWAGGGPHRPELPGHWTTMPADRVRPLILVDFRDQYDSLLARWSRQREREYVVGDWYAVDVPPEIGRIHRYLAAAPRNVRFQRQGLSR